LAFRSEGRAPHAVRAATDAGADGTRAERNSIWSVIVPADGTCAATWRRRKKGDFGTSPIYGQLSDKPLLAFVY